MADGLMCSLLNVGCEAKKETQKADPKSDGVAVSLLSKALMPIVAVVDFPGTMLKKLSDDDAEESFSRYIEANKERLRTVDAATQERHRQYAEANKERFQAFEECVSKQQKKNSKDLSACDVLAAPLLDKSK